MADKTKQYEGMFLVGSAATSENNNGIDLVKGMIERHGGSILHIKKWDERKLAYELKKQKRGTYIITYFKAAPSAIAPLERDVKLSDDVLRVLVTKADHMNQQEMEAVEPQPIVRVEERPSWDDRYAPTGGAGAGGGGRRDERPREAGPARDGAAAAPRPRREEGAAANAEV